MREAFPSDTAPRYLLRDRDRILGHDFVKAMGIKQVLSALRSPWQRAYVESVIGTIRRRAPLMRIRLHISMCSPLIKSNNFAVQHRARIKLFEGGDDRRESG